MKKILLLVMACISTYVAAASSGDFEVLFDGHGDINSYIYFKQDSLYFIDTELNVTIETIRYKKFFLSADLYKETSMARKYNSNMVFDPLRAHWSFGLTGRWEWARYFGEIQFHHDCFHSIDRWEDKSIYWNSPRIGFGTAGYLPKNKFRKGDQIGGGLKIPPQFDYYILASFFAPRGSSWQKTHDYDFTLNTNLYLDFYRHSKIGAALESNNLWVLNADHEIKTQNQLALDFILYGRKGVLMLYLSWWAFDNQSIRNKDDRWAFGLHLGF